MVSRKSSRFDRRAAAGSKCAQSQPAHSACGPSTRSGDGSRTAAHASPPELLLHLINNCRDELSRAARDPRNPRRLSSGRCPPPSARASRSGRCAAPAVPGGRSQQGQAGQIEPLPDDAPGQGPRRLLGVTASMRSPAPASSFATSASSSLALRLRQRLRELACQAAVEPRERCLDLLGVLPDAPSRSSERADRDRAEPRARAGGAAIASRRSPRARAAPPARRRLRPRRHPPRSHGREPSRRAAPRPRAPRRGSRRAS